MAAIIDGRKTALTGLREIYEHAAEPLPQAGQRYRVLDSRGRSATVIELTEVRVVPLREIDDEFARSEGRGYAGVAEWRAAHEELFQSDQMSRFLGYTPVVDGDTIVVAERFRVVPE